MSAKLNEMWAALEAYEPAPEYADAWCAMCRERTYEAASAAYYATPAASVATAAASVAAAAAWAAARTDKFAQEAIDAIREVKP
jgi:hypothetical protein